MFKNWPCVISCPSGGVGKYEYLHNSYARNMENNTQWWSIMVLMLLFRKDVCIYPTPPIQGVCDLKSIFRQNKAGLISDSLTGCLRNSVCATIYP